MISSNNDKIMFTILVPVYRAEKYIRACIDSVLCQTFPFVSLVLVDDGTPDFSGDICDEYAEKDSRIKVIHQKNRGLVAARRVAIEYALREAAETPPYLLFLDSDDSLQPNALWTIRDTILQHHCDLVVFRWTRVLDGNIIHSDREPKEFYGTVSEKRMLYKLVFFNSAYNSLCRKAAHSKLFSSRDHSEFYEIQLGEDLLQSIELYKNCSKAAFIPDRLYNYTLNPESITQRNAYENFELNSIVRNRVFSFLMEENVFGEEDIAHYIAYCRRLLAGEIRTISGLHISKAEKFELLRSITEDAYYAMLMEEVGPTDCLLHSLKKGRCEQALIYAALQTRMRSFVKKTLSSIG